MSELGGVTHLSTFDAHLRNGSFALISFMGFPAILSTLQPFQICIYNRKYSKLTFSNGSQLMGKRFMANLHASLESSCKIDFQDFQQMSELGGVNHLSTFDAHLRNGSFALISFMGFPANQCKTSISEMSIKSWKMSYPPQFWHLLAILEILLFHVLSSEAYIFAINLFPISWEPFENVNLLYFLL